MKWKTVLTTSFLDHQLLYTSLNLSQATYCNTATWNCSTCSPYNIVEDIYEDYSERVLIGYNTQLKSLFTAFRGSSNIQNWIDNVQIEHHCLDIERNICVEAGFYKLYEHLYGHIHRKIETLADKYSTTRILFTGHSLGSALTTLFSYNFSNINYNTTIVTFGSPRVGNFEFVEDFCRSHALKSSYRVTHYHDIVPHLPQYRLNYHHIPNEIWYNENNTYYKLCNDSNLEEDEECSNSCYPLSCTSTSDHLNYLNITFGSDGSC